MKKTSLALPCLIISILAVLIVICYPLQATNTDPSRQVPAANTLLQDQEITITITLTNGSTRTGILVAQTKNSITIKTETGTEVIQKKYIIKTDPPIPGLQAKPKKSSRRRPGRRTRRPPVSKPRRSAPPDSRFTLSLAVSMAGGIQLPETIYEDGITLDYLSLEETTYITPEDFPVNLAISAGFTFYFSKNLGLSLSLHYLPKSTFDIFSSYDYYLDIPGFDTYSDDGDWSSGGEISLMPVTINLVYSFDIGDKAKINLYAGPAIIFANIDLFANMGYGIVFIEEYDTFDLIIPEWFDIPLYISATETIVGGNAGIDIEYKLNNRLGFFAGFSYFFAEEREYLWNIDLDSAPIGEVNRISMDELDDYMGALNDLEVFNVVQFSLFKAIFGIKIYL